MFVIIAIIGISVLVFVHEFGHFIVAKLSGIKVEEFGIGYPPRMFGVVKENGKKKIFFGKNKPEHNKNTIYSLNWIPFGGFNKLKGELEKDNSPDSFRMAKWWKKFLVSIAGAGMNILFAILIFIILYSTGIPKALTGLDQRAQIVKRIGVQVDSVIPDSPAQKQGIIGGDVIKEVDGKEVESVEFFQNYISGKVDQKITVSLKRDDNLEDINLTVRSYKDVYKEFSDIYDLKEENPTRGVIGASMANSAIVKYPVSLAFVKGIGSGFQLTGRFAYGIYWIFKSLITKGKFVGGLTGPVGIASMTAGVAEIGYIYLIQFLAFISIAIAVFQLVPFPALDGSRALFAVIEGIKGSPIKHKTENIIISVGFIILLSLLAVVTLKEIIGLF